LPRGIVVDAPRCRCHARRALILALDDDLVDHLVGRCAVVLLDLESKSAGEVVERQVGRIVIVADQLQHDLAGRAVGVERADDMVDDALEEDVDVLLTGPVDAQAEPSLQSALAARMKLFSSSSSSPEAPHSGSVSV
jgi:hypothetical protein